MLRAHLFNNNYKVMKILRTNWINIIGVFTSVFLYSFISSFIIEDGVSRTIFQAIIASLMGIVLYGVLFWTSFIILLIILDLILIVPNPKNLRLKLVIEWLMISLLLILWAVIYRERMWIYGIFITSIIAFLITQLFREKLIKKANS